jgi:hypothetical protein
MRVGLAEGVVDVADVGDLRPVGLLEDAARDELADPGLVLQGEVVLARVPGSWNSPSLMEVLPSDHSVRSPASAPAG